MVLEPPRTYAVVGPRPSDGKIRGKAASEGKTVERARCVEFCVIEPPRTYVTKLYTPRSL